MINVVDKQVNTKLIGGGQKSNLNLSLIHI